MKSLAATMSRRAFGYVFILTLIVTFAGAAGMYAFLIAVYGYTIFGYVTATFATYFIGPDAEEKNAPVAGSGDMKKLRKNINILMKMAEELKKDLKQDPKNET